MYNTVQVTSAKANKILIGSDRVNWIHFCENHHGNCYWNKRTGEIMWIPDDGTLGNFAKLAEQFPKNTWKAIKNSYRSDCFAHWTNEATRTWKHDDYTANDEYGNRCAGPADERCPICDPSKPIKK